MCLAGSQTRRAGSYWVVACMDYRLENRIAAKMHKRRINKRIFALLAPPLIGLRAPSPGIAAARSDPLKPKIAAISNPDNSGSAPKLCSH